MKKELFVNKRRHLEFVYVAIDSVFGDHFFFYFVAYSVRTFFFYIPVNADKPNFVSFFFWYLLVQLVHLPLKFRLSKREAILNPVPKQRISKDSPSYGSQSERASRYPLI